MTKEIEALLAGLTPLSLLPWYTLASDNGIPKKTLGADALGNVSQNPVYDLPYNTNITRTQQVLGVFSAKYKIFDWLSLSSNNSYNTTFVNVDSYVDRLSLTGLADKGRMTQSKTNSNSFMTSNLATARKKFGLHTVGGLGGFRIQCKQFRI